MKYINISMKNAEKESKNYDSTVLQKSNDKIPSTNRCIKLI